MKTFVLRNDINARQLWAFLRANWVAMAQAGKPFAVVIAEHKAKRSGEQNRRLWALLNDISANAWVGGRQFSAEAWHEHFKRQFIGIEELPGGATAGISTTTLGVAEFSAYMDRIEHYAAQSLGIERAA